LLAIADRREAAIHIFDADNLLPSVHDTAVDDDVEREEVITMAAQAPVEGPAVKKPAAAPLYHVRCHAAPVLAMAYNEAHNTVISADAKGILEYWLVDPEQRFASPAPPAVKFSSKFDTDLYDIAKAKAYPQSIAVSPTGNMFVITSTDRKVRIFRFKTGKLARVYSESIETYEALHAEGRNHLPQLTFSASNPLMFELCREIDCGCAGFRSSNGC
jgi:WD40 repeat protein